ncbi:hypothetical protein ACHAXT_009490 [Thalassiosira profunda]
MAGHWSAAAAALSRHPLGPLDDRKGPVRAPHPSSSNEREIGAECVPSPFSGGKAPKYKRRLLDVGIFSRGGRCGETVVCESDGTSSLGGRCVVASSAASASAPRRRWLQPDTVFDVLPEPEDLEAAEEKFQACAANCPDIEFCDCFVLGGMSYRCSYPYFADACKNGLPTQCLSTEEDKAYFDVDLCPVYDCVAERGEPWLCSHCLGTKNVCEFCKGDPTSELCAGAGPNDVCGEASREGTYHYSQQCVDFLGGKDVTAAPVVPEPEPPAPGVTAYAEAQEALFQACRSRAPSADYDSCTVEEIASGCRAGDVLRCREPSDYTTFTNIFYCPLYTCYEEVGETDECYCNSYRTFCEYCAEGGPYKGCTDPGAESMCVTSSADGAYHHSTRCIHFFAGSQLGGASAATPAAQNTDATITTVATVATEESTDSATTTKPTIDGLGSAGATGESPPSSSSNAVLGGAAVLLLVLSGVSNVV